MATTFYPLTVKKIQPETQDCISIWLDVPEDLKATFAYQAGQHLTFRTFINNQEIRRTYSLCSSPLSNQWRVAVKQIPDGLFSNYVFNGLKAGDTLDVLPPKGRFFNEASKENARHYVAFAAGSGITPILSIVETTLQKEPASHFTLIYGNRNRSSIIFREELDALKNKYMSRFALQHVLSQEISDAPLQEGRIDAAKCGLLFKHVLKIKEISAFYLCGPQEMIFTVRDFLQNQGVDSSSVFFELFTSKTLKNAAASLASNGSETRQSVISLKSDSSTIRFTMSASQSVLEAALQHGAHLPYACKGGVCGTCKAKLVDGQVQMDTNYALNPEEVAAGYILTCQSIPVSENVRVDFDDI